MDLTNDILNQYYSAEVEIKRKCTGRAVQEVMPVVEKITNYINQQDPRFAKVNDILRVGSHFQGLKVKHADEFDFSVPLLGLPRLQWAAYTPRYYNFSEPVRDDLDTFPDSLSVVPSRVPLPCPATGFTPVHTGDIKHPLWETTKGDLVMFGDLIPFNVKRRFKQLLQEAIRNLYQDTINKPRLGRKAHGPALTLRIPYNDPNDPDIEEISIDFTPLVPLQMPFTPSIGLPHNGANWPSREKVETLQRIGINATAKKPFYWLRCFATCEKKLMEDIDKDGGCRKKCHRIMKRVREQFWCTTNKPGVSSYILKNVLWWECEEFWRPSDWTQDKLATRFLNMSRRLLRHLDQGQLPQYFEPKFNLLGFTNEAKRANLKNEHETIRDFMQQPMKYFGKVHACG